MKKIKVNNIEEALQTALIYLSQIKSESKVCFTGGKFGLGLLKKIAERNMNISMWSIFQTDERLECRENEIIQDKIIHHLKKCPGYDAKKNYFFPHSISGEKLKDFSETLKRLTCDKFDITFLSLGEDGHLAGHFSNSIFLEENKFCYTENAPKLPKKRISFSLERLMLSKLIVLASIGENKKSALNQLQTGKSIHNELIYHKGLILIHD